jgi:pyruvate formate lyase activating enzyme
MKIGAIQKFSLIDYPGKICAILFTQGCNFKCPYCHNPELVIPECFGPCISEKEVLSFLNLRKGKLDAISISGGEPSLQSGLASFIRQIKSLGYLVKLDTNGTWPDAIFDLLDQSLLDYIAMDIKAPFSKYSEIAQAPVRVEEIQRSIRLIRESGIDHEFRTTIVRGFLCGKDIREIAEFIGPGEKYIIQKFVSGKSIDENLSKNYEFPDLDYDKLIRDLTGSFPNLSFR